MANLRALNQQPNPFWEWVADMDNARQGREGPSGNGEGPSNHETENQNEKQHEDSQREGVEHLPAYDDAKTPLGDEFEDPPVPSPPSPPPIPNNGHPSGPPPHGYRGGWGGRGGHHHRGGRHGHGHGHHGPHGHEHSAWPGPPPFMGGHWGGGRGWGGWGGRGRQARWAKFLGGMNMEGLNMDALAQFVRDNFCVDPNQPATGPAAEDKDFKPPADLFDTPEAYIIHISLAGARKEDIGISWNPASQEIQVGGVIHRPGDEEFLKTIALEERDIGVFERNIKLGTQANPAPVNADGISAKMEDGVLMIRVPKDQEFVEVKHIDIE